MTVTNNNSSRSSAIIGIVIAVVIIAAIVGVWLAKTNASPEGTMRQVTYLVEATGGYAVIIYTDSIGNQTDSAMLTTPFRRTISLPVGNEVYLTASNPSQTGTITCKISINNREWKKSSGTHPVDSVACAGIIK
jgi:Kef-type K+ transport system membrane component KefB